MKIASLLSQMAGVFYLLYFLRYLQFKPPVTSIEPVKSCAVSWNPLSADNIAFFSDSKRLDLIVYGFALP